ncbi:unnamed protein product [Phytomonas sp. EM1]|nr:unnamed protein product [Phytomonas sp. EM1]|eukprot:CCW62908.1 unnamed protein product [Phytomonas sp. isolate EM1]
MKKEKDKNGDGFELKRKHGFKESRTERQERLKQEKQLKWVTKLQKEDLGKLERELDSLMRAEFLSPQQKERKRLVEKMVNTLRKINDDEKVPVTEPVLSSSPSSVVNEDFMMIVEDKENEPSDALIFVPRSFKSKRRNVEEIPESTKAKKAEKLLLEAAAEDDDDQEAFFASLI